MVDATGVEQHIASRVADAIPQALRDTLTVGACPRAAMVDATGVERHNASRVTDTLPQVRRCAQLSRQLKKFKAPPLPPTRPHANAGSRRAFEQARLGSDCSGCTELSRGYPVMIASLGQRIRAATQSDHQPDDN